LHVNVYYVFYSECSEQYVSAAIAVIFRVMLILQEHKCTNLVSCVAGTAWLWKLL